MRKQSIAAIAAVASIVVIGLLALTRVAPATGGTVPIDAAPDDNTVSTLSPSTDVEASEMDYEGFSTNQNDYLATIYINPSSPDKFRTVWYGKTTKNDFVTFSEFYGTDYPQVLLAIKDQIADDKIVVVVIGTNETASYVPVACKFIPGGAGATGMDFRCVHKDQASTGGKSREQLIDELNTTIASFTFLGAKKYMSPAINNPKFVAADADSDAIPDSIDSCPVANLYGEPCPEQTQVASGADTTATTRTQTDTVIDPNAIAENLGPQIDEGGACNMVATAPFKPMGMVTLIVGILPMIAFRRRRG